MDHRAVQPARETKSISAERTFEDNLYRYEEVASELSRIAAISFDRYDRNEEVGQTITIKLKYSDFKQITRSKTLEQGIKTKPNYLKYAQELLTDELVDERGIRLIGVGISNFAKPEIENDQVQLTIDFWNYLRLVAELIVA